MTVHFVAEESKRVSLSDQSLKLGNLRAGVIFVDADAIKEFRQLLKELNAIDGIKTSRYNEDDSQIYLRASKLQSEASVQEVIANIQNTLSSKTIIKPLVKAIENLTGYKVQTYDVEPINKPTTAGN